MNHFLSNIKVKSILVALFICITVTSGCDLGNGKSRSDELAFTVIEFNWKTDEYGSRFIAGTLINNTEKEYAYVEVEFNLYNDKGELVGSTFANMNNLMPKGTWNFQAVVIEDEAIKAKLKGVTGF